MLRVKIDTLPHKKQRYDTLGDYYDKQGTEHVKVSYLGKWQYELAVAFHELFEKAWCKQHGVKVSDVDEFDKNFEAERSMGIHDNDAEPGDDPAAPYYNGHQLATDIERLVITFLDQRWQDYELACANASAAWPARKPVKVYEENGRFVKVRSLGYKRGKS